MERFDETDLFVSLFHCLQPSTLYSAVNVVNFAQAALYIDL